MKEKELLASDYMTYYILQIIIIYNRDTVTTECMDKKRFAKKLDILERLNLTYNTLHNNCRDIITEITGTTFYQLKELRYIGEIYAKEHNMLTDRKFSRLVNTIQKCSDSIRRERNRAMGFYLDKHLLKGYTDLELTDSILETILTGIEAVEYVCNNYLKELNEILPCEQVNNILEKGYTNILLEALDN